MRKKFQRSVQKKNFFNAAPHKKNNPKPRLRKKSEENKTRRHRNRRANAIAHGRARPAPQQHGQPTGRHSRVRPQHRTFSTPAGKIFSNRLSTGSNERKIFKGATKNYHEQYT